MENRTALLFLTADVEAEVVVCEEGLSFWGGVDAATGQVIDAHHHLHGQVLAGNVRSCAVDCLKDGAVRANVATGGETQTTDETRTQVRQDVTVEVGHHQHVILTRILSYNNVSVHH